MLDPWQQHYCQLQSPIIPLPPSSISHGILLLFFSARSHHLLNSTFGAGAAHKFLSYARRRLQLLLSSERRSEGQEAREEKDACQKQPIRSSQRGKKAVYIRKPLTQQSIKFLGNDNNSSSRSVFQAGSIWMSTFFPGRGGDLWLVNLGCHFKPVCVFFR